jgi:hypothetical protein
MDKPKLWIDEQISIGTIVDHLAFLLSDCQFYLPSGEMVTPMSKLQVTEDTVHLKFSNSNQQFKVFVRKEN